ncbi:hypothetical protein [Oxalicibacterium solurbis]|uniref:hypothetical protein n=1 Tax=Oxalicibacterium solurbis TaxID=69280 RepID=UPI001E2A5405|nr:hypothetical protein [Oxalicibacterium solurbis]
MALTFLGRTTKAQQSSPPDVAGWSSLASNRDGAFTFVIARQLLMEFNVKPHLTKRLHFMKNGGLNNTENGFIKNDAFRFRFIDRVLQLAFKHHYFFPYRLFGLMCMKKMRC